MQHPYLQLRSEYASCLAHVSVTRPLETDRAARLILRPENLARYAAAVASTPIPVAFLGALDYRESSCNSRLSLGQGDPWNEVSRHAPRGFGPWSSWVHAAKFYLHYDHLDDCTQPWSVEYALWRAEMWNGLGPRDHGHRSGYLWSGTNLYDPPTGRAGKYVADGRWDPSFVDEQIGVAPILLRIAQIRPDLALPLSLPDHDAPPILPSPAPSPIGAGGGSLPTSQIQRMLNVLRHAELAEDGDYGRRTRDAVRKFQAAHGLVPDGLCGPMTENALLETWNKLPESRRGSSS